MRMLKIVALLGLVASGVAACNTFEGAGQDVQAGGRAIERSADSVQKKM
ncbi:putative small secreted protein [Azospirillum fermentarium]|nr:entericidin A/B family lipoprotein [Azospirillum fermentarium]MCW2244492.1 putative small secreted protein [Azospirillum fermentarium]